MLDSVEISEPTASEPPIILPLTSASEPVPSTSGESSIRKRRRRSSSPRKDETPHDSGITLKPAIQFSPTDESLL